MTLEDRMKARDEVKDISEWAQIRITMIDMALRKGHFPEVRRILDELEKNGLTFNDREKLTLFSHINEVFDERTTNLLERRYGVSIIQQLLVFDTNRLARQIVSGRVTIEYIERVKQELQEQFYSGELEDEED